LKILTYILYKVITKEFYRENAAFFLVVIAICGGFMSGIEHKALAEFFISSEITLLIPISVWIIYTLKIIQFNNKTILLDENEFVFALANLSIRIQGVTLLTIIFSQLLLVLIYAVFLVATAFIHEQNATVIYILLSLIGLILTATINLFQQLNNPQSFLKEGAISKFLNMKFYRHHLQFFPEAILREELLLVAGSKVFSGLLIIGVAALYNYEAYDLRLVAMGITIAMTGNIVLLFKYHQFEEQRLSILRNLPLSLVERFVNFLITFMIICSPEVGLLIKHFPGSLSTSQFLTAVFYAAAIPITLYSSLYIKSVSIDTLISRSFVFVMTLIVLILFRVEIFFIAMALLVLSVIIFSRYYYSYETRSNDTKE
jgi:hypothetical protein